MHFSIGQGAVPPNVPLASHTFQQNCPVPSLSPRTGICTPRHWHYGIAPGGLFATATVAWLGILSGEHTGSGLVMLRRAGVHLAAKTKMECKPPRRGANGRHVLSVKLCRIQAFIQDHHPKIQMPVLWSVSWWAVFCSMAFSRQD